MYLKIISSFSVRRNFTYIADLMGPYFQPSAHLSGFLPSEPNKVCLILNQRERGREGEREYMIYFDNIRLIYIYIYIYLYIINIVICKYHLQV